MCPREMRFDLQTLSLHYFQSYAVRDRIDLSSFNSEINVPDISEISLESFLPSPSDERILKENFSVLIGRVLIKHVPFFKEFGSGLEKHIMHEYSVEMARKSEVVCSCNKRSLILLKLGNETSLITNNAVEP